MNTIICLGYEGQPCGREVKRTGPSQKRCFQCAKEHDKDRARNWYKNNPERAKKKMHDRNLKCYVYVSARDHYRYIFGTKTNPPLRTYKDMPFEDTWNPNKGGSFRTAEKEILEDIGTKLPGQSLHIIHHEKGFVRGNLKWADLKEQSENRTLNRIVFLQRRIKQLERENAELKGLHNGLHALSPMPKSSNTTEA